MKNKLFISLLLVSILQVACDFNSTLQNLLPNLLPNKTSPKCVDDQVKSLAIENAIQSLLGKADFNDKQVIIAYIREDETAIKRLEAFKREWRYTDLYYNMIALDEMMVDTITPAVIDSAIEVGVIYLDGIRINEINNEIKKCDCSANIHFGRLYYQISYSAQYTEDNKLYVSANIE